MAFEEFVKVNPATHAYSEVGVLMQKLNQLFTVEGQDVKLNFTADGKNYLLFSTEQNRFEFYINEVLAGFINNV